MGVFDDLIGSKNGGFSPVSDPVRASSDPVGGTSGKGKRKQMQEKKSDAGRRAGDLVQMESVRGSTAGDAITAAGVPVADLPLSVDDVRDSVGGWLSAWCECNDVQDMRKASPLVFRAFCSDVGRLYIKPSRILKSKDYQKSGAAVTNHNAYDPASIMALYDVFSDVCGRFGMIPFQDTFAAFCGCSAVYIKEFVRGLTSARFDIAKRTKYGELLAIRSLSSRDPVGRLAILNNEYWNGGGASSDSAGSAAAALPSAGSFGLIGGAGID